MKADAIQEAFLDRLDRHRGILIKVARAYCHNPADRGDLVQETIGQLWRSYERFDARASFSTWMYRIAVNVAISFYRGATRQGRGLVPAEECVLEEIAAPQEANRDDRLDRLHDLIERLGPFDRALVLLYLDDYSHAEIAAMLGISETNVSTKIGRIKERLKREAVPEPRN